MNLKCRGDFKNYWRYQKCGLKGEKTRSAYNAELWLMMDDDGVAKWLGKKQKRVVGENFLLL